MPAHSRGTALIRYIDLMNRFNQSVIVVTGGCGFIGSQLVKTLLNCSPKRIIIIDSLKYGNIKFVNRSDERIDVVQYTLGSDSGDRLAKIVGGADYLFHLAAEKHNQAKDDPLSIIDSNIRGTYQILEAAAECGVKRVIFSSSLYVYGISDRPCFSEEDLPRPDTIYGMSKLAGENILRHFHRTTGLEYVILRYFFAYGPYQFSGSGYKSVIINNYERILRGLKPTVTGTGEQTLDYIYIDDVIDATLRSAVADCSGEVFNVGSGQPTRIIDLTKTMLSICGSSSAIEHLPPDWTAGTRRVGNIDKISRRLDWRPRVSLEEGLNKTCKWVKDSLKNDG